jgi:hypothetical protein
MLSNLLCLARPQGMENVNDVDISRRRGFPSDRPHKQGLKDFILATPAEGKAARKTAQ